MASITQADGARTQPRARTSTSTTPKIRHGAIIVAIAAMTGVPAAGREALGARIKALLGKGMRRHFGAFPGSGRSHRNGLQDAVDIALAVTLQRAFAPPAAIAAFMLANRNALDALWATAARGERSSVTIAIDALDTTAGGDATAVAIRLAHAGKTWKSAGTIAPPRLTIDLRTLYDATLDGLRSAGVARADLREAENAMSAG